MPSESIDDVIDELARVLKTARAEKSRLGYFPALYRKITIAVKEGIRNGIFEDADRLERLDVVFANRYLEALSQHRGGELPTASWLVAFDTARKRMPIVLQHLLLGMNAHINLDLGIASAEVAPGQELPGLRNDFEKINEVLAAQVEGVKEDLATVWPKLRLLYAGPGEDRIINFSIRKARDHSWGLAQELAGLGREDRLVRIGVADRRVAKLARLIMNPGPLGHLTTWLIRMGERGSVPEIIDLLQ